jgi:hypothetical protein
MLGNTLVLYIKGIRLRRSQENDNRSGFIQNVIFLK